MLKFCGGCEANKSISDFHKNRTRPDGRQDHCKKCFKERHQSKTPEERRKSHVETHYGLSWESYLALLEAQGGCCAICSTPILAQVSDKLKAAHVDHDHQSGVIRGLLCHFCNSGLGYFKDDPEILRKVLAYMARPSIAKDEGLLLQRKRAGYTKIAKASTAAWERRRTA